PRAASRSAAAVRYRPNVQLLNCRGSGLLAGRQAKDAIRPAGFDRMAYARTLRAPLHQQGAPIYALNSGKAPDGSAAKSVVVDFGKHYLFKMLGPMPGRKHLD